MGLDTRLGTPPAGAERRSDVNRPVLQGSFWPSEEQHLLFRIAIGPRDSALAAWEELLPFDVQRVEPGTFPLLPLVAVRLEQEGVSVPDHDRLQGTYRKTWYRNQMHVKRLDRLVRSAGRPVLLGGIAVAAGYYATLGLRPVQRTDVLAAGGSVDAEARVSFALRAALPMWVSGAAEQDFRARSVERTIADVAVGVLDATDELLLAVAQGARAKDPPSIQWLLDAHQIASSGRVDWEAFAERSVAAHLVRPVSDTFAYLASVTERPLDGAIARLATLETSRRERLAGRLTSMAPGRAGMLPRHLGDFLRTTADEPLLRAARGFPDHLRGAWGLERATEVPAAALRKAAGRARGSHRRAGPEPPPGR
jgi:hypothetical protein